MDGTSFAQQDEEAKLRGQFWLKLASMVCKSKFSGTIKPILNRVRRLRVNRSFKIFFRSGQRFLMILRFKKKDRKDLT